MSGRGTRHREKYRPAKLTGFRVKDAGGFCGPVLSKKALKRMAPEKFKAWRASSRAHAVERGRW